MSRDRAVGLMLAAMGVVIGLAAAKISSAVCCGILGLAFSRC